MTRPMTPPESPHGIHLKPAGGEPPPAAVALRALAGVVLVVAGSLTLLGLIWISNSDAPALERLMFSLGLALTSLISAIGQALVFVGLWLLWTAVHKPR